MKAGMEIEDCTYRMMVPGSWPMLPAARVRALRFSSHSATRVDTPSDLISRFLPNECSGHAMGNKGLGNKCPAAQSQSVRILLQTLRICDLFVCFFFRKQMRNPSHNNCGLRSRSFQRWELSSMEKKCQAGASLFFNDVVHIESCHPPLRPCTS